MATLTVHGGSDDLAELAGIEGADEFTVPGSDTWVGVIEAPNGETALLYVDLRKNGTWTVALGRFEEDYALPAWPVSITSNDEACRYSTYAQIEVPEGTTVREYND
jgi:hypothetical protein